MDYMNDRMEIVRQLRGQQQGNQPEETPEEGISYSFRIRCFLAFVIVILAFSVRTTSNNETVNKVMNYLNHNSSVEQAMDNFKSDVTSLKDKIMLY